MRKVIFLISLLLVGGPVMAGPLSEKVSDYRLIEGPWELETVLLQDLDQAELAADLEIKNGENSHLLSHCKIENNNLRCPLNNALYPSLIRIKLLHNRTTSLSPWVSLNWLLGRGCNTMPDEFLETNWNDDSEQGVVVVHGRFRICGAEKLASLRLGNFTVGKDRGGIILYRPDCKIIQTEYFQTRRDYYFTCQVAPEKIFPFANIYIKYGFLYGDENDPMFPSASVHSSSFDLIKVVPDEFWRAASASDESDKGDGEEVENAELVDDVEQEAIFDPNAGLLDEGAEDDVDDIEGANAGNGADGGWFGCSFYGDDADSRIEFMILLGLVGLVISQSRKVD